MTPSFRAAVVALLFVAPACAEPEPEPALTITRDEMISTCHEIGECVASNCVAERVADPFDADAYLACVDGCVPPPYTRTWANNILSAFPATPEPGPSECQMPSDDDSALACAISMGISHGGNLIDDPASDYDRCEASL